MCAIDQLLHTHFSIILITEFPFSQTSFPGSPHMQTKNLKERVRAFSVLQATESWAGPGNEANSLVLLFLYCSHLRWTANKQDIDTLPKGMFLLVYPVMFQTTHSPRWRRVVSAIRSPKNFLIPPNRTTILKFGPDPNTVAVCRYRGPISWERVTCTGGNSNWWNIRYITYLC